MIVEYEKINPRTEKLIQIIKGTCRICGRIKSQIFSKRMSRGEIFIKTGKGAHWDRSAMNISAWCDLNKNCTVLKLHDMCQKPKCKCQKQITFTPKQIQLESGSIKNKLQKIFKGTQTAWNNFLMPALKNATPNISAGVAMKTKNPQWAQVPSNILKSLTCGKILSLTDMHSNGLWLKVMWKRFKYKL